MRTAAVSSRRRRRTFWLRRRGRVKAGLDAGSRAGAVCLRCGGGYMPDQYCRTECEAAAEAQEGGSGCNAVQCVCWARTMHAATRRASRSSQDDGHSTTASLIKVRKTLCHSPRRDVVDCYYLSPSPAALVTADVSLPCAHAAQLEDQMTMTAMTSPPSRPRPPSRRPGCPRRGSRARVETGPVIGMGTCVRRITLSAARRPVGSRGQALNEFEALSHPSAAPVAGWPAYLASTSSL